jgi:tetratricopeptide (TPR) repeat protein
MNDSASAEPNRGVIDRLFPDRALGIIGGVGFLIVLISYLRTVSPTVSFWDCGEFIACSHILGIPHPPGSPLYVLIGRIFSILPLAGDISLRVNLLSSFSNAAAAGIAYFVAARLITMWYSDRYPDPSLPLSKRVSIYAGAFSGSLFFAFATTNWANAVEAEVYGLSMFLMMVLLWLTLIWAHHRSEPGSDRYLIAISYIALLSVGVHLTVFLVMPPIFLLMVALSPRLRKDPRFYITGLVLVLVTVGVISFLWAAASWMVITGLFALAERGHKQWGLAFVLVTVAILGWSVHAYIPIRSQLDPAIDQNDPETWKAFTGYLERKQYGEKSMFTRAMTRRGEWANQFGQHQRMGFWGFFDREYGYNDVYFFPLFILGLAGLYQLIRRRRVFGLFLLVLLLVTSVGLVWYMNFADGTRYNPATEDAYLEVRDRDYFFTPAFILFGLTIGLGGAALIRWLAAGSGTWSLIGGAIIMLLPGRALLANYHTNDRSRNYIAYDYGYNILQSADSTAVLFTNGDNDTFPVWCLQEVYNVRKDVRIANLSLLNTHWYIRELRDRLHVPMNLTNDEIGRLVHYKTSEGEIVRIQDQMVDDILLANKWREPIDFAVTVSAASRRFQGRSLDDNLAMRGLVSRLVRKKAARQILLEDMEHLIEDVFQFRGLNDPSIYQDENSRRLVNNYLSTFLIVADTLRRAGQVGEAERYVKLGLSHLPNNDEGYIYLSEMYAEQGNREKLDSLLIAIDTLPIDRNRVRSNIAYGFRRMGDTTRALAIMQDVLRDDPGYEAAYKALMQFYYELGKYDTLETLMVGWVARHPEDERSKNLLEQVRGVRTRLEAEKALGDTTAAAPPDS